MGRKPRDDVCGVARSPLYLFLSLLQGSNADYLFIHFDRTRVRECESCSSCHLNQKTDTSATAKQINSDNMAESAKPSDNPDVPADAPHAFIPLEANPELMTKLIHKLGISDGLEIHDVLSLTEPELLAFIPRPALALLLVFPVSATYESARLAEDATSEEYAGKGEGEPVVWFKQTIRNACGLMGLLHATMNGPARDFIRRPSSSCP
jgi:hypothetical protein